MQELAKALRGASTEVQDKIFRNMSQRAAAMLKEDIGALYIYRNEPAIFGLENRRDKPTTLNLQKSSPGKIRTYTTRIQRLRTTNYATGEDPVKNIRSRNKSSRL